MLNRFKSILSTTYRCIRNAANNTVIAHDGVEHAGYLAFLGMLSLFPFLVFIVAIVGQIGQGASGTAFISAILQNLPQNLTSALRPRIEEIISGPPQGLLTISIIGVIWTASSAVEGLRTILNRAYHVETPPAYLLRRLMSIVQMMIFAFIIIVVMLLQVVIPLLLHHVGENMQMRITEDSKMVWDQLSMFATPLVLFAAVCFLYYVLPNIKQRFISVAPGAAVVAVLLMGNAYFFTLYLSKFNQVNLVYGSLGGVIAAMLFAYICNLIVIFGAELNYQIVKIIGMRVVEKEHVEDGANEPPKEL